MTKRRAKVEFLIFPIMLLSTFYETTYIRIEEFKEHETVNLQMLIYHSLRFTMRLI